MKCPKCSYVSFDYNLTCPKCDKDISSEQEKLHLQAFRPDPPQLLGALTGEINDTHGSSARGSSEISMSDAEVTFDDESTHFDSGEVAISDSGDFELGSEELSLEDTSGLSLNSGAPSSRGKGRGGDILGPDLDTEDAIADLDLGAPAEDELGSETGELEIGEPLAAASAGEELELDLEDGPEDESSLDLGALDLEGNSETAPVESETQTRELRLDGESTEELDKLLDMDEISLEEIPLQAKPGKGSAGKAKESDLSLDLGELDLELDLEDGKPT